MTRLIVVLSILGIAASTCFAADIYVPPKGTIESLVVRNKDVFASTREGLYRALKSDKHWKKLPTPKTMPVGGKFATQPKSSNIIFYAATKCIYGGLLPKGILGLYSSSDSGQHWSLVRKDMNFKDVYVHPNGTIYAITEDLYTDNSVSRESNKPKKYLCDLILISKDGGKSWRDITGSKWPGLMLVTIIADPDHPDLVCISGNLLRGYVLQASDENYNWKPIVEWEWDKQHETDESFFQRYSGSSWKCYTASYTLNDYFLSGGGIRTYRNAFDIILGRPEYRFTKLQPKIIKATVKFIPDIDKVTLLDFSDDTSMWGVKVIDPQGKRTAIDASVSDTIHKSKDRETIKNQFRARPALSGHVVDASHSYTRDIDIGKLYDFSQPGKYRVQLLYDSMSVADKNEGEWPGFFTGQVFTVIVE